MPEFSESALTTAPPEEVWKLLYDPARFPDWWLGVETVESGDRRGGDGDFTFYPEGYPDFPMPQVLESGSDGRSVRISCLVSDIRFEWRLELDGDGTRISVEVEIPPEEAHRLEHQHEVATGSLANLVALAESA
jgi:uncharacterized protein YndB with AHSA1/START domain